MKKKILVFVAHSDDETLGMGGTIKKHTDKGDNVIVISMTDGVGSRKTNSPKEIIDRQKCADKASSYLGFSWGKCFDFEDNKMDTYPLLEIIKSIEIIKNEYNPCLVYTHSSADLNIDHRVLSNAVITAFRPQPEEACKEIRLFEVPSATDYGVSEINGNFIPNLYVGINVNYWEAKLKALKAYKKEIKAYPHSRSLGSIENLAKLRGNQVGLEMAEAFQIIRKIDT